MLYLKFNYPAMKMLVFYFLTITEDRAEIPVLLHPIVNVRLNYYWALFKLIAELIPHIMACFVFLDRLGRNFVYPSVSFLWKENSKVIKKQYEVECFGNQFQL